MTVQFVEIQGAEMAIMPAAEFHKLAEMAEERADIEAAIRAQIRAEAGEEFVPHALVSRLVDGEPPLRVWREYRGVSQAQLGKIVGVNQKTISLIEAGKRDPGSRHWLALAEALNVDIEDILPLPDVPTGD